MDACNRRAVIHCLATLLLWPALLFGAEVEPDQDAVNPLLVEEPVAAETNSASNGIFRLWEDSQLVLNTVYYGRARSADNRGRDAPPYANEIHVNALGQRVDFISGYAWGVLGFDVAGQTNLGQGNGWSEVLWHREPNNKDRSSASLGQAALKTRFGNEDIALETRGGFTPISVGSLGTSGGLFSHAYRGVESKLLIREFQIGYGWADQFRNEWDNTFRDMTGSWEQNRFGGTAGRISYIHSLGARYAFGTDKTGFVDVGVGEGRRFRKNMQAVVSAPFDLCRFGMLTLTGYGIMAKYNQRGLFNPQRTHMENEYHVSGMATLKKGDWTLSAGFGHTSAPDSEEMQFRLTPWGNSDNRNFIQTWAQLDDFVWDGQNVVKLGAKNEIGKRFGLPGLSAGASYNYAWNARNPGQSHKSAGWEINYHLEYAVPDGRLKGLALGVYAGHLRYGDNNFHGKQDRNDVKVIVSYARTLEGFLRRR